MKILKDIVEMIKPIIELIRLAEELLPEKQKGSEKLLFVKELLHTTYEGVSENWDVIEKTIQVIVSFFNKWGIFQK